MENEFISKCIKKRVSLFKLLIDEDSVNEIKVEEKECMLDPPQKISSAGMLPEKA
jgi:hypothetical protein